MTRAGATYLTKHTPLNEARESLEIFDNYERRGFLRYGEGSASALERAAQARATAKRLRTRGQLVDRVNALARLGSE